MSRAALQTAGGHPAAGRAPGRRRGGSAEQGFSLIELLVVCLVIAVLCAIAIPQFLAQSDKARDASAKELVHHAQVAAETIATENDGSYENVTREEIARIEPGIPVAKGAGAAYVSATTHAHGEYSVTVTATDGDELSLSRAADGEVSRTCRSPITKTGCAEGESGSW